MAHIKEPKGVDFVIQSEPLTQEARKEISDFIRTYKAKHNRQPLQPKDKQSITATASR